MRLAVVFVILGIADLLFSGIDMLVYGGRDMPGLLYGIKGVLWLILSALMPAQQKEGG